MTGNDSVDEFAALDAHRREMDGNDTQPKRAGTELALNAAGNDTELQHDHGAPRQETELMTGNDSVREFAAPDTTRANAGNDTKLQPDVASVDAQGTIATAVHWQRHDSLADADNTQEADQNGIEDAHRTQGQGAGSTQHTGAGKEQGAAIVGSAIPLLGCSTDGGDGRYAAAADAMAATGDKTDDLFLTGVWGDACGVNASDEAGAAYDVKWHCNDVSAIADDLRFAVDSEKIVATDVCDVIDGGFARYAGSAISDGPDVTLPRTL